MNLEGSRNVFEAAAAGGAKRLVYASSVAAYGFHADNPPLLTEDIPARGTERHYYSAQKAELERVLREVLDGTDTAAYVFRPCIVAGPDALALVENIPYVQLSQRLPEPVSRALELMPVLKPVLPDTRCRVPARPPRRRGGCVPGRSPRSGRAGRVQPGRRRHGGDVRPRAVRWAGTAFRSPSSRSTPPLSSSPARRSYPPRRSGSRRFECRFDGHLAGAARAPLAAQARRSRDLAGNGRRRPLGAVGPLADTTDVCTQIILRTIGV